MSLTFSYQRLEKKAVFLLTLNRIEVKVKGTFEEKINQMLQDKKHLADLTVAIGEKWIGDLSNNELQELVNINN